MSLLHDGKSYDALHAFMVRDLEYWQRMAGAQPRRVLELACGTGRVAIPLARDGHAVTGIDHSESMLDQARSKAGDLPIRFVRADIRDFAVERFDLIICPFNGLRLLLERADLERCLVCVRRALRTGASFAFDVSAPRPEQLVPESPPRTFEHADPETGAPIVATHQHRYDRLRQLLTLDASFRFRDGTTTTDRIVQRIYFPQEIFALLAYNGFRVVDQWGDYDGAPLTSDSQQLLVVATPIG
jgi:SAM-dependent methyltransferase